MNKTLLKRAHESWGRIVQALEALQPIAQLAARTYLVRVFFYSGLTKIRDWDTTLALFNDEYKVPLLPPDLAAYLGTFGELTFPVLLVLGLFGRPAAAGLMVVNIMAALSLPDIAPAALQQHEFWGSLILALLLWGPGKLSVDNLWGRRFWRRLAAPAHA